MRRGEDGKGNLSGEENEIVEDEEDEARDVLRRKKKGTKAFVRETERER
jgi:hypothetical protein